MTFILSCAKKDTNKDTKGTLSSWHRFLSINCTKLYCSQQKITHQLFSYIIIHPIYNSSAKLRTGCWLCMSNSKAHFWTKKKKNLTLFLSFLSWLSVIFLYSCRDITFTLMNQEIFIRKKHFWTTLFCFCHFWKLQLMVIFD